MDAHLDSFHSTYYWKSRAIMQEKDKSHVSKKEEVKWFLFAGDITAYVENPKESTQKLLELTDTFSNASEYKDNTEQPAAFLYTNKEQAKKEN